MLRLQNYFNVITFIYISVLIFLLRQLKLIVWKLRNRWLFWSLALNEGDVWEPTWCKEVCIALDCWPKYGNISRNHSAGRSPSNFPEAQVLIFAQLQDPWAVTYTVSSVPKVTVTPSVLCIPAWYTIVALPTRLLHWISEFLTAHQYWLKPALCVLYS